MPNQVKIYLSKVHNPAFNLAFETYLLHHNTPGTVVFYLWQNDKTIVIGRHQNPYKECNLQMVERDHVTVIRRTSGGGAVYHDLGNLNFTFIADEETYDIERQCGVIIDALKKFGLNCETNGRNDMTIEGAKFSGHAYMQHENMFCHHGTLLVNANLQILSEYLTVSDLKLKSKGIDSVTSRVVNLADVYRDSGKGELSVSLIKQALIETFLKKYPYEATVSMVEDDEVDPFVRETMQKFDTWKWNVSESLAFDVTYDQKFKWGLMEISITCDEGIITDCDINTDCLLLEDFSVLKTGLIGTPFEKKMVIQKLGECLTHDVIKNDLAEWFDTLLFSNINQ